MFRERTNLYLSYRRTFPHFNRVSTISDEEFEIYSDGSEADDDSGGNTEHHALLDIEANPRAHKKRNRNYIPKFILMTDDIDSNIQQIEKLMQKLSKLYKKNSLPGFEDKSHDEDEIEEISFDITKYFQKCYNVIKTLSHIYSEQKYKGKQLKVDELMIVDNLQKKYALKIQSGSNKFRVLQNSYLKFLNKDDLKPIIPKITLNSSFLLTLEEEENIDTTDTPGDIESYSRQTLQKQQKNESSQQFLNQRDEEIKKLAKGVLEVSTIFREMQNLIIDQGTIVDRIDYNLENTVIELKQADKEINKAVTYQKNTQKCKIILLLSLCVLALFLFIMLRPHGGKTRIIEKPVPALPTKPTPVSITDKPNAVQIENSNNGEVLNLVNYVDENDLVDVMSPFS
ncbi:hypothetical protein TPHA_0A02530 [Tetrapisispora phaffii CBS 4417]|uniref:t-SNARE coiled-coil homology domain-containing protein n=1 Tax=Tetrapisispora phaffii (strain ATCC 24235 / CBS 4417 / NBRC 1672 / NRRL Y-8282 / UCD 70-5) TaxID=1071381 RepID=G8BN58_TETPH|nr:hypothetical protein TPHA_0A02530 [Tetrapisispora phaffii CBS 4417]CCE61336.1 hypothetical protein TPHA_0A02530 [Tetrapisispora phaffii CBS 4417]